MAVSECPACTCHIPMREGAAEGDTLKCPDCGALLRVKSAYPPVFELAKED